MKKILFLFLATFLSVASFAQKVSVEDAQSKAFALFHNGIAFAKGTGAMAQPELSYCAEKDGHTCFYVFNNPGGGFAIIGGDESAREVLGYSCEGEFDINNIPDNMREMLESYENQIVAGIDEKLKIKRLNIKSPIPAKASASKADVEPLVKTKWGQNRPFNSMIPSLGTGYSPLITGCGATAAAQIMKYYEYAKGEGSNRYQKSYSTTTETITLTFEADFASTSYDFGNMLDSYNGSYTKTQEQAVGTLMYHAGVAMNMSYGQGASSALTTAPGQALANNFGYDKGITMLDRTYYTDDEWENLVYNELAAGRPIIYSGRSATGGHAFIMHGYKAIDDTYCVNWGWDGYCDGYFALSGSNALNSGSSNGQFNDNNSATINIKPDEGGDYSVNFTTNGGVLMSTSSSTGDAVDTYELNKGAGDKDMYLFAMPRNSGLFEATVEYGVAFRNIVTGEILFTERCGYTSLKPTYFYTSYFRMPFNTSLLTENGTYEVFPSFRPYGSNSDSDWQLMRVDRSTTIPTIKVVNADGAEKIDVSFAISSTKLIQGKTARITAPAAYDGTLTFTSSDEGVATVDNDGTVTAVAPGTATITVSGTETDSYNATTEHFTVTVEEKAKTYNPFLSMTEDVSDGSTHFALNNNGSENIELVKLVVKRKSDYAEVGTYTMEEYPEVFGTLYAGRSWRITINTTIPLVYNWYYIYNGYTCLYCNDSYDPLYEPDDDDPTPPTPDYSALIAELNSQVEKVKIAYNSLKNLSSDMDEYLQGCIRVGDTRTYETLALKDIDDAYQTYMAKANEFIKQLSAGNVPSDQELEWFKELSNAFINNSVLANFKEYTEKATITAEGNGTVMFCGNDVRNQTKTFAFYYPKAYTGVETLCYALGVTYSNPINFFNEEADVSMGNSTYSFDLTVGNSVGTFNEDVSLEVKNSTTIKVVFHDNTALISELEESLNTTRKEYAKATDLSRDMDSFLAGCIRTSGMKEAEKAALQDIEFANVRINKYVESYINELKNHHAPTDSELREIRKLASALNYNSILANFQEYVLKATITAEGNGTVMFCGNEVRNQTKIFAFYYPKAYTGVEVLCDKVGESYHNPIDFFQEKAIVTQDDASCSFDVVRDNSTPVTYEQNTEITVSDPTDIIVIFHDYSTGIHGTNAAADDMKVYDISGRQTKLKSGINIVVDKDGKRRKVVIKK